MITGDILNAVLVECSTLLQSTGAQVILKTNFDKPKHSVTYSGNLILLSMDDAPDSMRYPGGLTRLDWNINFDSYNYEPNAMVDDMSGYSESLLDFIDMVRQHFSASLELGGFLTTQMKNVYNNYGFQFTFGGIRPAMALETDGLIMGWGINMESTALDQATQNMVNSSATLQHIEQDNDIGQITLINSVLNAPFTVNNQLVMQQIPANTFVQSINIKNTAGTPTITIGTTSGGNDIQDVLVVNGFQKIVVEKYFQNAAQLFFNVTNGTISANIEVIYNFL